MVLTRLPAQVVAGDNVKVRYAFPEAPAGEGYDLKVTLNPPSGDVVELDGVPEGDAFIVTLTSAESEDLVPGRYAWAVATFDTDGERTTQQRGHLDVLPDPSTATGDQRSWARQALAALEAALLAQSNATSYSLFGRSYAFGTHSELIKYREYLRRLVSEEDAKENGRANTTAWVTFPGRGYW